ncbi:Pfg377-like protein [Plasmodium coatneyi]|uniref:Pfg377-like protein n=1 Tax=Plasmodium coatneyi TaxID=208452 RepID=A0A1B1E832_9APIC|nr:Pfg377-like protein [Plasmodium coatneyi]ANQ11155.1 Pfg377-like protein [Plasmodium coatneyi]
MRLSLCATLLCLLCGLAKCRKGLNFDQIIKYLKETKIIPENIPDTLEDAIQIVPPYIIYKYKGKIYYLHNNVDITPVDERKADPVFPVQESEVEAVNPLECHPIVPGSDGAVTPLPTQSAPAEEAADTIKMVLDEDTGIMVATNTNVIIEKEKHTTETFTIPKDAQWSSEEKEKNTNVYLFGGENSTVYKITEIVQYKENKDICKNIQLGYERFYNNPSSYGDELGLTTDEKTPKVVHNVDTKDYSSFLTALHILFRKDEEIGVQKIYKINNVPKTDLLLFIKQAYKNIHDTLKNYILVSGFSFYDYTYDVGSFSLDVFMNDFFFLSNSDSKERGTFKNVTSSIKYASTAKDKLSVYKIEKAIKDFLAESNLRVLDLKLIHHLFSRNFILNCTENDLIDFVTNLVNITGVDISPRIGATIFAYLLQKVNIYLMPSYPTKTRNSYLLFMENNDLLFNVESIYRDIFKNFYRISSSNGDLPNAQNLDNVLALTPWVQKIYPNFGSTYDFLTMKYGLALFYNTYHMVINFFQGDPKMKQILLDHKDSNKVDTLDKFLNEVVALFPQGSGSSAWPSSLLSMAQVEEKPRGRVLSEDKISTSGEDSVGSDDDDDDSDDVPDDEDDEESKEVKEAQEEATADENHADVYAREKNKYNELRQVVETELIQERKEYAQKKHEEEERIKKEEQDKIAETDRKHELETQQLEAEEDKVEPIEDAQNEKEYQKTRTQERERARLTKERMIKDGTYRDYTQHEKTPESFYYSTALNSLYSQLKKEYEAGVDAGFKVVADITLKLKQECKALARKGVPDYVKLKQQAIRENEKLFEDLSAKVKNEESRKENILEYKSDLDAHLDKMMAKTEDGQYNITTGLLMKNFKKYQNDLTKQCEGEKGFYGKFRKFLGKRKKTIMKQLRETLNYSIRIMQDLAPSYDEPTYTKTFTDIFTAKKEAYKKEFKTARRVISRNMDAAFRKHIKLHYEEIDLKVREQLQPIRQQALNKIDEIYADLFNTMHVEVQIDLESIKNEKLKMKKRVFQIVRQNTNYPNDLKLLEDNLAQYNADQTPEGITKKDQLNAEITKLKQTIEKNKSDASGLITHFQSISERYEQALIKMDAIDHLEKRFRLFRFEVAKEYKDCNHYTDALVPHSNKNGGEYIRIENITKDLLNDIDQINYDINETRFLLHALKTKKKHIELDIQIGEKLYHMEENSDINSKNDANKEKLKEIVTNIENEQHKLEKLYIRRDVFMKDLNFVVSDTEKDPPETLKLLLPDLIKKTEKKNLESFIIEIMIETEIENNALSKLIKTFNKDVLFYKYHTINPYDYLRLPTDEKNIDEQFSAQLHRNAEMFADKLESFRGELQTYKQLVKKQGGVKQPEALTYLKRNIAHLKNIIHSLRNGTHIEDFSYILTNPDFFQSGGIKNEDRESELAHTALLKRYVALNSLGKVLTDTQNKAFHFGIHYKYTSDKVLWYLAILKKYIERTEMVYNNSYDWGKKSRLNQGEYLKNRADAVLEQPVLLQYGGDIWDGSWGFSWGEAADKQKYLRVVKKEQTYPYKLKEIKDVYVVDKIVKDKLVRTGKLDSLKDYMHVKVYNIVEVKGPPMTLFDKEELNQLKLLTPDGHITQGSVKNYMTHLGFMSKGGATSGENASNTEEHLPAILQTAAEYLKQSSISYDAILEVLKYLKANPHAINVRDIITVSEIILDNSNVFFVKPDTLSIYIITFLDLLGVQVKMDDIQRRDRKSRVMTYLNILKSYYKKVEIKDEMKKHVLRFLRPTDVSPTLSYNPKLHEFLLGVHQSLDGNQILYEAFKKENPQFATELLSGIKKGLDDFVDYIFAKVATHSSAHFKSKYYHDHKYKTQEMEKLGIDSYSYSNIHLDKLMTLFFYFVNPDLRNMLNEHVIDARLSCLDKFSTFDFKEIFSVTNDTELNKLFEKKFTSFAYGRVHPIAYLWRYLLHPDNKELFTFEKVSSVVEKYFSDSVFDDNTRVMLSKLAYSFLARMSYHTVSYFDIQMEHLIEKSDIELISLFHNILNKLNFLLYCTNKKPYLERYAPANLLPYSRPFKLDALKIFHQFVNSLPNYLRSYIVNFFETDFSEVTQNLIVDLFHHIQSFLENDSNSFESEDENKIESFFKLNYFFTKNKNVTDGDYQSMLQEEPHFKEAKIIFSRRVTYDHVNKKSNYQENLHLKDLIDEQSFKMLLQTLIKEQITFDELNEKFKNFMKEKKLVFPKFDILKTKITQTADDLYFLNIYKHLYDTFQKIHVTQPIHDLYFLFFKVLLEYSVAPFKFENERVQKNLEKQLALKYQKYIEFLSQLFPCLFNFYYYDDTVHCQNFGNYSEEEFSPEQKMLNILQTPFVQLPQTVQNNQINLDYHINEEDLFFDFIKEFIPDSQKMDENQLKVESFKIRYFITEISKFVMRKVMSKMPSSYIFNMGSKDFYINVDDIINNLQPFFEQVRKVKAPSDPVNSSYGVISGTIANFMDTNKADADSIRFQNIKFYLNSHVTQLFLQNNMSFKYFIDFIKNIDKFKTYFPTLSEMYMFVDKHVNIINAITHPNFTERVTTQRVIQIFVDTLKNFGVDLYEI